jgi:hypothetical protein
MIENVDSPKSQHWRLFFTVRQINLLNLDTIIALISLNKHHFLLRVLGVPIITSAYFCVKNLEQYYVLH